MGRRSVQRSRDGELWGLVSRQHGVVSRAQLLEHGLRPDAIQHRLERGRLHRVHRGVYAVGRPDLDERGRWMAAVLAGGRDAVLSDHSAAGLWGLIEAAPWRGPDPAITIPPGRNCRVPGIRVRRRRLGPEDRSERDRIPVTSVACTLVDLATELAPASLERAVNAADRLNLIDPEALRETAERRSRRLGAPALRRLLDATTFVLTDSELERRFIPIARSAGLPLPRTGERMLGLKLDFYWRQLGLVVETDGLRYHRTASQQNRDRRRDQILIAAGITVLRFTHAQVAYEPERVRKTIAAVVARIRRDADT